jgi:hypothetical protein
MIPDDKTAQSLKMLAFRSLKSAFDNTLNEKVGTIATVTQICKFMMTSTRLCYEVFIDIFF